MLPVLDISEVSGGRTTDWCLTPTTFLKKGETKQITKLISSDTEILQCHSIG